MRFAQWVAKNPRGVMADMMRATGLSYQTLHNAKNGRRVSYRVARTISEATDGAVSVAELCEPADVAGSDAAQ